MERFDIDKVIKILSLDTRAEDADGGTDFDVACRIAIEKLEKCKKYEELQAQGRLLELPCAVGDNVWNNHFGRPYAYEVTGFSFGDFNEDYCEDELTVFDQVMVFYRNSSGSIAGSFATSEIGKTVFLSWEEAKKALEGKAE